MKFSMWDKKLLKNYLVLPRDNQEASLFFSSFWKRGPIFAMAFLKERIEYKITPNLFIIKVNT